MLSLPDAECAVRGRVRAVCKCVLPCVTVYVRGLCMNMCRDYTQASSPPVGRVTASFQRGGKTKSINRDHMHKGPSWANKVTIPGQGVLVQLRDT